MKHVDIDIFTQGKARYVDDISSEKDTLILYVFTSPIAHGKIDRLDISHALLSPGVAGIFTAKDIAGENQIGEVLHDEPLLADTEVMHIGQPIAVIAAESKEQARTAAQLIECDITELPAIFDAREAYAKNELSGNPEIYQMGDVVSAWKKCDVIVEGRADCGGQEHLYFETQSTLVIPTEQGGLKIFSSTQSTSGVQRMVAHVLGIPMNTIEVDVTRIGGGFGGKEFQAGPFATMAALVAMKLQKPAKLILSRKEDMKITGKRNPYSSSYKMGLSKDGMILAYEVFHYQNSGAFSDLSLPVLHKSTTHSTGAYFIPNVKVTGASCRTNLPPNTAFRGFGSPQAVFAIETAVWSAAQKLGIKPEEIQRKNLLKDGDELIYGAKVRDTKGTAAFDRIVKKYDLAKLHAEAEEFNGENRLLKKGISVMPLCFGISFDGSTFLDQASATVHVFTDGSVSVSTAAVEMGQGVNSKIREIAAKTFSIRSERIKVESTNTTRIANTSATAASSGSDLNGNATILAIQNILERLKIFAALRLDCDPDEIEVRNETVYAKGLKTDWDWSRLIIETYMNKIGLSAHAFYRTPEIGSDPKTKKGKLFAYHVFGAAITEATIDILRGTYTIDSVKIIHDVGKSLIPGIDLGQIEGALIQGIGWMTTEELLYDTKGRLRTSDLATYKIPDIYSVPEIETEFLENSENKFGPFNSKAIGEPPLLYGIGSYFAIIEAVRAHKKNVTNLPSAPLTPEKLLLTLYDT